ncbi:hypothetical protein ACIBL6_18075 [Streptomyces sp. NPDC050400]|uniref:hypothetical protein n=1 Tax=Streptomyces sp. NPDC050400 TaxID=3365610 RepID=UPI00378E4B54
MTTVSAGELLDAWESGWGHDPLRRGLALFAAARRTAPAVVAELPVGRRDRALFAFRAALFGTTVNAVSRCPGCGTDVEVDFDQEELLARLEQPHPADGDAVTMREDGREVRVRLPTSADLAAVLDTGVPEPGEALVSLCTPAGGPAPAAGAVAEAWLAADPLIDVRVGLGCPDCGTDWEESFDIVGYLWAELDAWGRRTLMEVHELARAYGWTEPETLALSPWRRQCYLGLVAT